MKVNNQFYLAGNITPGEKSPIHTGREKWLIPESVLSQPRKACYFTDSWRRSHCLQSLCNAVVISTSTLVYLPSTSTWSSRSITYINSYVEKMVGLRYTVSMRWLLLTIQLELRSSF
jgi:hypothetical protein